MQLLSPAFAEIRRLRIAGNHPAAFALIQASAPASDADALEAVVSLYSAGNLDSALRCARAWPWRDDWTRRTGTALAGLIEAPSLPTALPAALADAKAAAHDPAAGPAAAAVYLLLLQAAGRVPEAAAWAQARLRQPPQDEPLLLVALAELAVATGDPEQAYRRATAVLAMNPYDFRALMAASAAHLEAGNPHEAFGNALRANRVQPAAVAAVLQMMRCRHQLGDHIAALADYASFAAAGSPTPALLSELGLAHAALGDRAGAIAAHERALAGTPPPLASLQALLKLHATDDAPEARTALAALEQRFAAEISDDSECGFALALDRLRARDLDGCQARLEHCFALARGKGVLFDQLPWPVPEPLLRHDIEQLALLEQRGKLSATGREALAVLKPYAALPNDRAAIAPPGAAGQALREAMAAVHHDPDPPYAGRALGERDYAALEAEYFAQQPPLLVIDDFLAPDALAALRAYCEEATVWKAYNEGGYTGAFLGQGFRPRVLLAIADELKQALPQVIGGHPLMQAWAFKYDQRHKGIKVHADFARVNVNFWITPQSACADPATGGMVIYDVPAPADWTFADFNTNAAKMEAFLKLHGAQSRRVPYRENRCVLFDSRLFHVTDTIRFKPGYTNRRINVTLLYGSGNGAG
jgi:hypothetical protein